MQSDNPINIYGVLYAVCVLKNKTIFVEADGLFKKPTYLVFCRNKYTEAWDIDFEETRGHILILHLIAAFDYVRSGDQKR